MKDNLEKEAYRLRFEYFNTYEKKRTNGMKLIENINYMMLL